MLVRFPRLSGRCPARSVLVLALGLPLLALAAPDGAAPPAPATPAAQIWINVGGFSRHFDRSKHHNERNFGFGIEWRTSPELSYMAGVYDNSVGKHSQYLAANWQAQRQFRLVIGSTVKTGGAAPDQKLRSAAAVPGRRQIQPAVFQPAIQSGPVPDGGKKVGARPGDEIA